MVGEKLKFKHECSVPLVKIEPPAVISKKNQKNKRQKKQLTKVLKTESLEPVKKSVTMSYDEIVKHLKLECSDQKIHLCPMKCTNQNKMSTPEV